jgi:Ca2+-binding RTX toxin-like protein
MAATPFTNPRTGRVSTANRTDHLIWSDTTSLNNNRIIGPSKLWGYGAKGQATLPALYPENFTTFITQYPHNGSQLAQAGAFGQVGASAPLNNIGWQVIEPPQKGGPGIDNGYTYSLRQAALALNGISESVIKFQCGLYGPEQTLPSQGTGGFQGFYTYPKEDVLGGITYLADQVTTTINVGPLAAKATIGTGGRDDITGTSGSDVISGGYGADQLSGQDVTLSGLLQSIIERLTGLQSSKASDLYLYLRADSSQHGSSTRDVITDFSSNDFIDLSAIDANSEIDGMQSFSWIGSRSFTATPGQLRIEFSRPGGAFLQGDIDGNGRVDFEVEMLGIRDFSHSNLILS